jgi:hypothetical protein
MKKTLIIVALVLFPCICTAKSILDIPKGIEISKCGSDCLEIKTRNDVVYRVYSCGKLDKLVWKELSENKDDLFWAGDVTTTGSSITLYPIK